MLYMVLECYTWFKNVIGGFSMLYMVLECYWWFSSGAWFSRVFECYWWLWEHGFLVLLVWFSFISG